MGYVYQRDNGTWMIAYKDVDGRLRRRSTKAPKRALAERLLGQAETDVEKAKLFNMTSRDDINKAKEVITFRRVVKDYLQHHAILKKASAALRDEVSLKTLLPSFGARPVREITVRDVERYTNGRLRTKSRRGGSIQPRTVMAELSTLSGVMRFAVRSGWLEHNPVRDAQKPRLTHEIVRWLDADEERAVLAHAPAWLRPAIVFAIHTGLRAQEQAKLAWPDVKIEERKIIVRAPKNRKDRAVDLSNTAVGILEEMPRFIDSPYVFTNPKTRTAYDRFNNKSWRKALYDAGVKGVNWHCLRHTFGSRLAQRGVPLKTIQELMGHSDITMTMRYAHMAPDNRADAVKTLDAKPGVKRQRKVE